MAVTAHFPAIPESVTAPLLVGLFGSGDPGASLLAAWRAAAAGVPVSSLQLNVPVAGRRKAMAVKATRQVAAGAQGGQMRARLIDRRDDETQEQAWRRWRWAVTGRLTDDRTYAKLLGEPLSIVQIEVTDIHFRAGAVNGAPQLALFRHYLVTGLRAIDPTATVIGGQTDWDNAWWAAEAVSS